MNWNPGTYNKFKEERYLPFYDLLSLVQEKDSLSVIDLGCGTGELTRKLADKLNGSTVLGIDSSEGMLQEATAFLNERVCFEQKSIETILSGKNKYDLVFSNAALQWLNNHETLIPAVIALLNKGGQLAVQVPSNHDHFTHTSLREIAAKEPYCNALKGWVRTSPVLTISHYAQLLFNHGGTGITVFEKVYPHVLRDANAVYDWVSGTALLGYLSKLPAVLQEPFKKDYRDALLSKYTTTPVFYPFKRVIMSALF